MCGGEPLRRQQHDQRPRRDAACGSPTVARAGLHCIDGLAHNARLEALVENAKLALKDPYRQTGIKQRRVGECSDVLTDHSRTTPPERHAMTVKTLVGRGKRRQDGPSGPTVVDA